jgi:hypothetical protein
MRRSMLRARSRPGSRRTDQVHVLDDLPAAVADHALGAGVAAQPVVERQLQAFLAAVVDVGEAEHVRDRLALRVEAAVFALRDTPGMSSARMRAASSGLMRRFRYTNSLSARWLRRCWQFVLRHAQRTRQRRQPRRRLQQFLRIAPDRLHRRGHRQRLAVAVGDHAARGRDRDFAQEARIALLLVELVVDDLQVDRAQRSAPRAQAQRRRPSTTGRSNPLRCARRRGCPRLCALATLAILAPGRWQVLAEQFHRRSTTMSGARELHAQALRATWSTRLLPPRWPAPAAADRTRC